MKLFQELKNYKFQKWKKNKKHKSKFIPFEVNYCLL